MVSWKRALCVAVILGLSTATGPWVSFLFLVPLLYLWISKHVQREIQRERTKIEKSISHAVTTHLQHVLLSYDPTDPSLQSLQRFQPLKKKTQCIFAKTSKVWGSADWDVDLSLEANLFRSLGAFIKFFELTKRGYPDISDQALQRLVRGERVKKREWDAEVKRPPLDGFLVEVRGTQYFSTLQVFGDTVRRVLTFLGKNDPAVPAEAHPISAPDSVFNSPHWHFSYLGESTFVTTFCPLYPSNHARYAFADSNNSDSCFVLLQPEASFLHHNLSPDTPHTNWDHPQTERDRIRCEFRRHGRGYLVPPTVQYPTAHHIVPPLDPTSSAVVEWWIRPSAPPPGVGIVPDDSKCTESDPATEAAGTGTLRRRT